MGRRVLQLVIAFLVTAATTLALVVPARADTISLLLTEVNAIRTLNGVGPLTSDPTLTSIAQTWSDHLASTGVLADNANLNAEVPAGWSNLGENVGYGTTVQVIFDLLLKSPPHLANMLTNFNLTGIAVASSGKYQWFTEVFETKGTAAPVTKVTAAPTPTTLRTVPTTRPATVIKTTTTTSPPLTTTTSTTSTTSTTIAPPVSPAADAGGTAGQGSGAHASSGNGNGTSSGVGLAPLADAALSSHTASGSVPGVWILVVALVGVLFLAGTGLAISRLVRSR